MKLYNCPLLIVTCLALAGFHAAGTSAAPRPADALEPLFAGLDPGRISTGILYDRVVPFSRIERYDGSRQAPPVSLQEWWQIHHEMTGAAIAGGDWATPAQVLDLTRPEIAAGRVPLAFLNFRYNRIRPNALQDGSLAWRDGRLVEQAGDPYLEDRVFAAAALRTATHRGRSVTFVLNREWYLTNDERRVRTVELDFADGRGFVAVGWDRRHTVQYGAPGSKLIRSRLTFEDGEVLYGDFVLRVQHLQTPTPDDTLAVTATIPYQGGFASGEAYVYLSPGNAVLTDPVIVIEGFDLDNSMNWDELYYLLNQQGLIETLRGEGFDAVVLNFAESTDYIQSNGYLIVELIQQVLTGIDPQTDLALIGASMGGLAARYALAFMEDQGLDHRVRAFISFDAPQNGANIPLGLQYWLDFFKDQSEAAGYLLSRLDTPAARQMLVYHHTDPPGTSGESDPLRGELLADLAGLGQYPLQPRKIAVANGSGSAFDQGFAAGDQIIQYEYYSFLVDVIGNVWAVPDGSQQMIFDGLLDLIWPLPDEQMSATVTGTQPFDNAPGGWRASMAQMDTTSAPYGDIVALHDHHCFIPTASALDLQGVGLFHGIAGDPDLMSKTPFDAVYFPVENQEHVSITAESAEWFLAEIRRDLSAVATDFVDGPPRPVLRGNYPNPFNPATRIRFDLPQERQVTLKVYSLSGRMVALLADAVLPAGHHEVVWDGRDDFSRPLPSGLYVCRLQSGRRHQTGLMTLLR